jgi:hypothetical protein
VADVITIEALAKAKGLPSPVLRQFGLVDTPRGVRFEYRTAGGARARPRLRTALRGAEGSEWDEPATLPISVYTAPADVAIRSDPGDLIIVEGESDCWAAWSHGVAALGIPGPENFDKIETDHIRHRRRIYLLREPAPANSPTYSSGIAVYLRNVAGHLRRLGYEGEVLELRMPDGLYDLSELHLDNPERFLRRLSEAQQQSSPIAVDP